MKYLIVVGLISISLAILIVRHSEKRAFNKCKCKNCGHRLIHTQTDSSGSRLWYCPMCRTQVWISYDIDRKYL